MQTWQRSSHSHQNSQQLPKHREPTTHFSYKKMFKPPHPIDPQQKQNSQNDNSTSSNFHPRKRKLMIFARIFIHCNKKIKPFKSNHQTRSYPHFLNSLDLCLAWSAFEKDWGFRDNESHSIWEVIGFVGEDISCVIWGCWFVLGCRVLVRLSNFGFGWLLIGFSWSLCYHA